MKKSFIERVSKGEAIRYNIQCKKMNGGISYAHVSES